MQGFYLSGPQIFADPKLHRTHGEPGGLEDKVRALDGYPKSELPFHVV